MKISSRREKQYALWLRRCFKDVLKMFFIPLQNILFSNLFKWELSICNIISLSLSVSLSLSLSLSFSLSLSNFLSVSFSSFNFSLSISLFLNLYLLYTYLHTYVPSFSPIYYCIFVGSISNRIRCGAFKDHRVRQIYIHMYRQIYTYMYVQTNIHICTDKH